MKEHNILQHKIAKYKKKFFATLLIKGICFFGLLVLSVYIIMNFAEHLVFFGKNARAGLLFAFVGLFVFSLFQFILKPLFKFRNNSSDEQLAIDIGNRMPNIKDKLLNTILLMKTSDNSLALASVAQRSSGFSAIEFDRSIDSRENYKYLAYLALILVFLGGVWLYKPLIFSGSTSRILNFDKDYNKPSAFELSVFNESLQVFENEDITLNIDVSGQTLPQAIYVVENGVRYKATQVKGNPNQYEFTFKNVTSSKQFNLEAAGYSSEAYDIDLLKRPGILKTNIYAQYPAYVNLKNESFNGINDITIPEGTVLNWEFITKNTESLALVTSSEAINYSIVKADDSYKTEKQYKNTDKFSIKLANPNGENKDQILYNIQVIKDLHPKISLETNVDTSLYEYITLAGNISDDYGINGLKLKYRTVNTDGSKSGYTSINIPVSRNREQSYFHQWNIDSLVTNGKKLEYFVQVWDNDGVNGSKSSKSSILVLETGKQKDIEAKISQSNQKVENNFESNIDKVEQLKKQIESSKKKMQSQKKLNWQDKNELKNILEKQNDLQKSIEELSKEFDKLKKQQDKFDKQNPELDEKAEKLQELLDQMMDEETKEMFKELEKMLEKKDIKTEEATSLLEKMEQKDFNLEKELERAKELFNKLKFEEKLDETIEKLDELAKKQEDLAKENADKKNSTEEEKKAAADKQEELNKEFDDLKEDLKELDKLNEDSKSGMEDQMKENQDMSDQIDQQQDDAKEDLNSGDNKSGSQKQSDASDKMKKMSQSMSKMKQQMGEAQQAEDLDNLRRILDNLIKVSYDQEDLMNKFKTIRNVNPQFVEHSAKQLKIKEDATIIEDSLLALASRNFEIKSFVTRELFNMNDYIDQSLESIRDRKVGEITKNQQFAMTHINNLALMLSEVMDQMQQQQSQKMDGEQMCNNPKPGGKKPKPGMKVGKKQQALSQQIMQIKQSGKSGKELSESLAKMAAEQEQLRKSLKELEKMQDKGKQGKDGKDGKGGLGDIGKLEKLMEENEIDLLNKRLTQETINRQKEIITRLLEAEKAMRERDWDKEREAKTAKQFDRTVPPSFEKYLKEKEKQIELLKTVNPAFVPYFKEEINEYLRDL